MKHRWRTAVVLFATAREAAAAPTFAVSTDGDCPNRDALVSALSSKGYAVGGTSEPTEFFVVARADPAGASLCLSQGQSTCLLERHFESADCRAVAEAMAVVVEAYFIDAAQLGYRAQPPQDAPPTSPAPVPAPDGATNAPREIPAQAPSAAPPQPQETILPPSAPPSRQTPKLAHTRPDLFARGFAGIGAMQAFPDVSISPLVDLGVGLDFASLPLTTDAAIMTSYPRVTGTNPNRVWRWASQGSLRLGVPWLSKPRVHPWAAVGLSLVRLRAEDLAAPPTKTTSSALVGAGLSASLPLSGKWFGRIDVGCLVIGTRDQYEVQPTEEIGFGPRVVCTTILEMGIGGKPF